MHLKLFIDDLHSKRLPLYFGWNSPDATEWLLRVEMLLAANPDIETKRSKALQMTANTRQRDLMRRCTRPYLFALLQGDLQRVQLLYRGAEDVRGSRHVCAA